MKGWATKKNQFLVSAAGTVLAVAAGLLLWWTPMGDSWTNASYNYLFRFGSRPVTNSVVLILMDNRAYKNFGQVRGQPWDRALHTRLLNRLADDGCALVVFDSFFHELGYLGKDDALAAAMARQKHIVLMASQNELTHPELAGMEPIRPAEKFLNACGTNWGVAWLSPDLDSVVRRQWPFPSPGPYPSLPWTAAQQAGKKLSERPLERWVRYYGQDGPWVRMSYEFALTQPTDYFRNKIVFVGNWPATSMADGETDEFSTPYTRWTGETSGGVAILLASFLNLLNDDSLLRPAWWIELSVFVVSGILIGGMLSRFRFLKAVAVGAGIFTVVSLLAISLSYFTNYWFPWLIIVGGQLPVALAWTLGLNLRRGAQTGKYAADPLPDTPGYELLHPPFGEGAYGKVWLARNKSGQWRALKVVYLAKFQGDPDPYEREFKGVKKYQPISDRHPGLLRVEFVSEKLVGYFYYVMELADSLEAGWESHPSAYKPHDLVNQRARLHKRRLPVTECLRIGIALSEALDFLHCHGMTHRDIKPQNVIFINGQPKLADLGLITGIRPAHEERTLVGTPGYMPPSPERPGTVAADIYALGMVLYVLSTGRTTALFPEVATTLVNTEEPPDFLPLNKVILKACQPQPEDRYTSAQEMRLALVAAKNAIAGRCEGENHNLA